MTRTSPPCTGHGSVVRKALNAAVTAAMNEFGTRHGCRPMQWYLIEVYGFDRGDVIGFPGPTGSDPDGGLRVAQSWASLLGLNQRTDDLPGYRSWLGIAGTIRIEIWCRATTTGVS